MKRTNNTRTCLKVAASLAAAVTVACSDKPKGPPVHVDAPQGAWISLFNGRDLTGWTAKIAGSAVGENYRDTFTVSDGLLKVGYQKYDTFGDRFGSLYYDKPLSHYWLRVEYRFTGQLTAGAPAWAALNSGIQLQGQTPQSMGVKQQFPVSVEFDLVGSETSAQHPTGDVCHYGTLVSLNGKRLKKLCSKWSDISLPADQWVTALAEVDGARQVRQIVNGTLIVQYTDLALDPDNADARVLLSQGAAASLGAGTLSLQSNGAPIEFRRIEILPLP